MCGIVCAVLKSDSTVDCINKVLTLICSSRFSKRGPDACCYTVIKCGEYQVVIVAGLLSLRGPITPQPIHDNHRALAFNGEIYRFGEDLCVTNKTKESKRESEFDAENENDTRFLWRQLTNATSEESIWSVFEKIEGAYAFIFADELSRSVLFGRDIVGRRSLLIGKPKVMNSDSHTSIMLLLSSVALANDIYHWTEVESNALFRLALNDQIVISGRKWQWKSALQSIVNDQFDAEGAPNAACEDNQSLHSVLTNFNCSMTEFAPYLGGRAQNVEERLTLLRNALEDETIRAHVRELQSVLEQAVSKRVACIHANARASVGLLFSGGVDSTVLALLVSAHVPPDVPIELINVSFNDLPSNELESNSQVECDSHGEDFTQPLAEISPFESASYEQQRCVFDTDMAARFVAAANSTNLAQVQAQASQEQQTRTPDRVSAISAYGELVQLQPERDWRLVLVDVSRDELERVKRQGVLVQLSYPRSSIFDENLCASLWFAARGRGHIYRGDRTDEPRQNYVSQSRVLLLGSGIDEQLVGYSRHRRVYAQGGMRTLVREMALELSRLGERNLGRDDRAIADHGREARLPYLDERVVRLIAELPLAARANLNMPRGVGEKLLLRTLAFHLGLRATAVRDKKAMQFGTHIVRVSESKRLAKAQNGGVFDQREPIDDD